MGWRAHAPCLSRGPSLHGTRGEGGLVSLPEPPGPRPVASDPAPGRLHPGRRAGLRALSSPQTPCSELRVRAVGVGLGGPAPPTAPRSPSFLGAAPRAAGLHQTLSLVHTGPPACFQATWATPLCCDSRNGGCAPCARGVRPPEAGCPSRAGRALLTAQPQEVGCVLGTTRKGLGLGPGGSGRECGCASARWPLGGGREQRVDPGEETSKLPPPSQEDSAV